MKRISADHNLKQQRAAAAALQTTKNTNHREIISVIFMIRQFNDDNDGKFGFISYDIATEPKIQLFARLQVCLCMLQGLSSIIQALPVIILYQSFGVDPGWVVLWCFWWSLPLFLLWRLTAVLRKYIFQLKHPTTYYRVRDTLVCGM